MMYVPVMVPWTTEPFLSSMETVSLFNFIKNLMLSMVNTCDCIEKTLLPDELHDGDGRAMWSRLGLIAADRVWTYLIDLL